ncbi:MAG: hypothetical protein A2X31_00220 [Elusimicrobia bacterium GWB2_63_22]|nr:MAG: hypothetical protein A2X31_00220 [Elusimicrobia bacterium GWB2_63_22]
MKKTAAVITLVLLASAAQAQRVNLNSSAFHGLDLAGIKALKADIPAPVSDVEKAGPRVALLLNADESNRRDPVWPGYDVFGQPVLLYEAGIRSFLIAHPNPPAGYAPLFAEPRPVFVQQGQIPGFNFTFSFHFPLNGVDTFAYRYKAEGKPEQDVRTMVHERFHVFQQTGFKPARYARRDSEPDGEDLAMAALEQKTLKSALAAEGTEAAARFVRQFAAVREERYARFPDARLPESREERLEGMARYVDQALMLRDGLSPQPGGQAALLSMQLDWFPDVDKMEKSRYYATGAAQGLLLDRAGRSDWKALVAAGAFPYEVIRQAFPLTDPAAALAEARREHGYAALLATGLQKASAFQAAKTAAIAAYEALPGIEWSVPTGRNMGFSAASPDYQLSGTETLLPEMYMIDAKTEGYALNVTDRQAVLADMAVRFHAQAAVLLDGRAFTPADGVYSFETLTVTETGLDLRVSRPGTLTVTGRKAAVSLD